MGRVGALIIWEGTVLPVTCRPHAWSTMDRCVVPGPPPGPVPGSLFKHPPIVAVRADATRHRKGQPMVSLGAAATSLSLRFWDVSR